MNQPFDDFSEIPSTFVELLRYRAINQPNQLAFTFLQDGETEDDRLTYQELDRRSRAIAAQLQKMGLSGERALLLYPPGLDYLAAFFGCLYAGVVAVPAYPPRNQRNTPRIQAVACDAQASVALTTAAILSKVQSLLDRETYLGNLHWLTTDSIANLPAPCFEDDWQEPFINGDTLAFLQYTSGSTGTPKGAMLSHGNLLHNAAMTYRFMEHSPNSKFFSWLPTYHDMGLIGGILQPLYGGFPCILMPPAAFLQRPYRWLLAISQYQATTSGGPNFAYELCIHKITPEQRETLDLSSWSVAFNGAEPIRQDTLERFAAAFASCGFRKQAFYPCYGMAEATLMVSGGLKAEVPVIKTVQGAALERNQVVEVVAEYEDVRTLVSCGQTLPQQQIVIAHPETLTRCQPDEVGEIWVSGPSVGHGYWNHTEETQQTFHAYLLDTDVSEAGRSPGPFLRTGDLGFLHNGELFITGRAKDLIIIRGRNLYPQDIELKAERSHPALRSGSGAAFAVEVGNEERLVVVQELEFRQKPNVEEVVAAIRQAAAQEHEVQAYAVVLIKAGSIPKTSSGKIQRRACRQRFLSGELDVIESSILENSYAVQNNENSLTREALLAIEPEDRLWLYEAYLQQQVARVLKVEPSLLNPQQSLNTLGIDSIMAVELKNCIEDSLGVVISMVKFLEGPSVAQLALQAIEQLTTATPTPLASISRVQTNATEHPLSFAQQRLWFLDQLEPGNPFYNIAAAVRLMGPLNIAVLEQSLNAIAQRHEALRTTFTTRDGKPFQVIAPALTLTLPVIDLGELKETEQAAAVGRLTTEEAQRPFDLSRGPLLRCTLLRLNQAEHVMLLTMHHIASDGWSMGVLIRELAAFYEAFSTGKPSPLPELPIQYADFAIWQRQWLSGDVLNTQLAYWKQQLGNPLPVLDLPTDYPRPPVQTFKGAKQSFELSKSLTEALRALSRQEGVTLFMSLLAAFKLLLYRYTGQNDILVGSAVANRNQRELKPLIGFFVNTLVLRTNLCGNPTFRELLGRVREVALGAYANQDLPFDRLVEELQPERDLSRNPVFQVWFALNNTPMPPLEISGLTLSPLNADTGTAQFDLSLDMEERAQGLIGWIEYSTGLFNAATITRMVEHFKTLLESIVHHPAQPLWDLPILTKAERRQLLVEWNDTQTDYPQDECIHQVFEAQVERSPDAIAVVFENEQLTYRELNQRANQLAHHLQKLGVGPEVLVGICADRSLEMVVGILGILKAGGAYVPLNPAYPKERLAFMLEDAGQPLLLTQQRLREWLPENGTQVVCLDADWKVIAQESQENLVNRATAKNLAYAIYTSGSTGKPKGVMIQHRSLVSYTETASVEYAIKPSDRILQFASISFDAAAEEIFPCLAQGATLVLRTDSMLSSVPAFLRRCRDWDLTVLDLPTAFWHQLTAELFAESLQLPEQLRLVIIGGEKALPERLAIWQKHVGQRVQLVNSYGPTEATIVATMSNLSRLKEVDAALPEVPIGHAIDNVQVYVLDPYLQPTPVGVPGELYIGGVGIARGYLYRPELTAEKFIPNPFSLKSGTRLYKTGDLARYLPNGNIEFLGRIDHQVKIRGFRIELGEIEARLNRHAKVREAVVVAWEDELGDKRLVAYVSPHPEQVLTVTELRSFLKQKLPEYMVPSAFVLLPALPLTPNGKVDRRALPPPESSRLDLGIAYVAPQTEVEQTIAAVWQEILQVDKVGIDDNFFDLGGNSLLIVQVHSKLLKILRRDLSVVELFQHPTISALSKHLSQEQKERPAFELIQNRAQKQKQALTRQKQLMKKKEKDS